MRTMIAVHKLRRSEPGAGLTHTGRFDRNGNPVLKKAVRTIHPGEFYQPSSAGELAHLLSLGAVRDLTDAEATALSEEQ